MSKTSKTVPAITEAAKSAGLVAKTWAKIEKRAAEVDAAETEARSERRLQLVSSKGSGFRALIQSEGVTIEMHGTDFAISTSD